MSRRRIANLLGVYPRATIPPDFFTSREDAVLVWTIALLAFAVWNNGRAIGGSALAVLRTLLQPKLVLLYGSAIAYSAACVYVAYRLDLWHIPATKATIYWFFGTAVVLVSTAVTDRDFLAKALRRVIAVTIVIEFIVNVYTLPLAYELVVVFIVLTFSMVQVVAQRDPKTPAATTKFIEGVLVTVGLLYLGYVVVRVAEDPDGFFTRRIAEDFLVGPILTVALIPFLFFWSRVARWEQERLRRRFRTRLHAS